jgi:CheY-like chemotaxis protein
MIRVLIVEDDVGDTRLIVELLREASNEYAIDDVTTLREEVARAERYDVALLDLTSVITQNRPLMIT